MEIKEAERKREYSIIINCQSVISLQRSYSLIGSRNLTLNVINHISVVIARIDSLQQ